MDKILKSADEYNLKAIKKNYKVGLNLKTYFADRQCIDKASHLGGTTQTQKAQSNPVARNPAVW